MIETECLYLLLALILAPLGVGMVWAFLTRPSKYHYKFTGGRLTYIRPSRENRKEK